MLRLVSVEFGPSRSKRFGRAVAEAQDGPGECGELEPGRYRARFVLEEDASVYTGLARLLERVRHWRATEVYGDDELVSVFHAKEMAWCASFYLGSFGVCRERFDYGVLPRCAVCPLFDSERAVRACFRAGPAPGGRVQIGCGEDAFEIGEEPDFRSVSDVDFVFNRDVLAPLGGRIPDWVDLGGLVPDFPPEEWGSPVLVNERAGRRSLVRRLLGWIGGRGDRRRC